VWNGTRDFPVTPGSGAGGLNILLIGRFNAWKGQTLLIEAVARLTADERRAPRVRIVGSVFEGQEHFQEAITAAIARHGLGETIEVLPFDPVPDAHYAWADVVAVPSTRPEPFGLVAIEAMSSGRAVIAAGHGGLAEIVVDGETGALVPPDDADALAVAIRRYIADPDLAARHGRAGRARYEADFAEAAFKARIADLIDG
jgi:glycosyltransferase involved in cell wall biosynthesis